MRIETIRVLADWLIDKNNVGFGINTLLPRVPVDQGDAPPKQIAAYLDPMFPDTTIAVFDETRHPWVIARTDSPVLPALYIMSEGPTRVKGMAWPNGQIRETIGGCVTTVRYVTSEANIPKALVDGDYVLRAVTRSVLALALDTLTNGQASPGDAARTRNGMRIVTSEDAMEYWPVTGAVGNGMVAGGLKIRWRVRDQNSSF